MPQQVSNLHYLLDSDEEPLRLERQGEIYGVEDDLRHLALLGTERVLDAGCGPGAVTRPIAAALPKGHVIGIDRDCFKNNLLWHQRDVDDFKRL